jgi:hypothetical protein
LSSVIVRMSASASAHSAAPDSDGQRQEWLRRHRTRA